MTNQTDKQETYTPPHSNAGAWNAVYKNDHDKNEQFLRDHTTVQARKDAYHEISERDAKVETLPKSNTKEEVQDPGSYYTGHFKREKTDPNAPGSYYTNHWTK